MKNYAIAPEVEQLDAHQGEFHFHPAHPEHAKTLSPADVERFNIEGFLSPLTIMSDDEIATHRRYFDELLAQEIARGGNSYSISTAHLKYGPVYDLLRHPSIVGRVVDLLGPDVIGWGSHFFCKMPGDGQEVAWHQDATYWPLAPTQTVTVWLAIDDADRENGCMRVITGSHTHGRLGHATAGSESVLDRTIPDAESLGSIVDVELTAGQASIHSDLLVHGSHANQSQRRRCGLTLRYCTPQVVAGLDWNEKGIVVAGSDPTGHWTNATRPAADF